MDEKDKKEYELSVLVKSEDDVAPIVALVRAHNGEIVAEPRAKKLALAYEIKKNKEAIFASLTFKSLPEDCKNLEKSLRTTAQIIRALIVVPFPPNAVSTGERPSPMSVNAPRTPRTMRSSTGSADAKPAAPAPLSNEALEKRIEEILK